MQQIKDEVLVNIIKKSERFNLQNLQRCTASALSEELSISRSLASHYLNELADCHTFVKIVTRPVIFLHRQTIEDAHGIVIQEKEFLSIEEFQQYLLQAGGEQSNFTKIIGYDGSLQAIINQSTSALLYPPNGLPMIFYGEHGTGKSELVSTLYDFALSHHIFMENSTFHYFNLEENEESRILVSQNIEHLLQDTQKTGILCIHHAQKLNHAMIQSISLYIHRQKRKSVRDGFLIVFCMEEDPSTVFSMEFLQHFPVLLYVPSIEERSLEEKEEQLMRYLKKEESKIAKPILISSAAFRALCQYSFPANRIDMEKSLMLACAAAMNSHKNQVEIYTYCLPSAICNQLELQQGGIDGTAMISVKKFSLDHDLTRLISIFEKILSLQTASKSINEFILLSYQQTKEYYDNLMFRHLYVNQQIKTIEGMLEQIMERVKSSFHITLPAQCTFVLARMIYLFSLENMAIKDWLRKHEIELTHCVETMRKELVNEEFVCNKIRHLLAENFNLQLHKANVLLLLVFLGYYGRGSAKRNYLGLIVSHGYATASSICDAVNTLIGEYVFDAIDMPLDTSSEETVKQIEQHIQKFGIRQGVIVLVDMGSLETIGEQLAKTTQQTIGVMNNVSTKLALQIGYGILQNKAMKELLSETADGLKNNYTMVDASQKQDAIIFTSESGEHTAKQMMQLFIDSLPVKLPIEILTQDYMDLQKYGKKCPIFSQYHVLFLAGTLNPKVEDCSFIAVEDIISGNIEGNVLQTLSRYLKQPDIDQMKHRLLVNFSLQNVMEHITILNPNKLLNMVVDAIDCLEKHFTLRLDGKSKIGLYLHVSCLIERLVTKRSVENEGDLHLFEEEKPEFIIGARKCFQTMIDHYHVEVPVNELLYLYEYIIKDEKEIKRYRGE